MKPAESERAGKGTGTGSGSGERAFLVTYCAVACEGRWYSIMYCNGMYMKGLIDYCATYCI